MTAPLPKVEELAETRMAQRISQLKGVGLVSISLAASARPVRVQARNPTAPWHPYGLSLEALRTALSSANVNQAKGSFDGPDQAWTINDNATSCNPGRSTIRLSSPTGMQGRPYACETWPV